MNWTSYRLILTQSKILIIWDSLSDDKFSSLALFLLQGANLFSQNTRQKNCADPDPHHFGKPDPHQSEKSDPDPDQSQDFGAVNAHKGGVEGL